MNKEKKYKTFNLKWLYAVLFVFGFIAGFLLGFYQVIPNMESAWTYILCTVCVLLLIANISIIISSVKVSKSGKVTDDEND